MCSAPDVNVPDPVQRQGSQAPTYRDGQAASGANRGRRGTLLTKPDGSPVAGSGNRGAPAAQGGGMSEVSPTGKKSLLGQ